MKNFTFLKPIFTQGMLFLLGWLLLFDSIIYFSLGFLADWWKVSILQLAVVLAYVGAMNMTNPHKIPWGFALKWWPEEEEEEK